MPLRSTGAFHAALRYGEVALALFVVLTVLALFFMSNVITGRWKGAAALQKKLYAACQLSRYHAQLLLHNLMALAVVILFFHLAVRMKQFWDNGPFAALSVLCCVVSVACWIWHIFLRKGCAYRVTEVIREGAGMTTLRLEPAGAKVFDYMPGQFAYFRFHDPALTEESHPFTLSSSPKETLAVTIKDLGDWSSRVQEIRPGSLAELDGPYGRFSPLLYPERPSVFIAGGVGITPMMSILHDACLRGRKSGCCSSGVCAAGRISSGGMSGRSCRRNCRLSPSFPSCPGKRRRLRARPSVRRHHEAGHGAVRHPSGGRGLLLLRAGAAQKDREPDHGGAACAF